MSCPEELQYWTSDEVAEVLGIPDPLYGKLWSFLTGAKNPTPLGGDGSDGTVETPDGRLNPDNDDKAPNWWNLLSTNEQKIIIKKSKEYHG